MCRENRGSSRDDHLLYLELPGHLGCLESGGAAKGHHGEPPGVHTALDRHQPDALGDRRGDNGCDTLGSPDHIQAQGFSHVLSHSLLS